MLKFDRPVHEVYFFESVKYERFKCMRNKMLLSDFHGVAFRELAHIPFICEVLTGYPNEWQSS